VGDQVHQPEDAIIADDARQDAAQEGKIDGGEELHDIAAQGIAVPASEAGAAIQGFVSAFALTIGVGIADEAALEKRLSHVAQRVMDDAIDERRRRDDARLGIGKGKAAIAARAIGLGFEPVAQAQEMPFQIVIESADIRPRALAARRLAVGSQEVFKRAQILEQVRIFPSHVKPPTWTTGLAGKPAGNLQSHTNRLKLKKFRSRCARYDG
jgi:hypothetical protein